MALAILQREAEDYLPAVGRRGFLIAACEYALGREHQQDNENNCNIPFTFHGIPPFFMQIV